MVSPPGSARQLGAAPARELVSRVGRVQRLVVFEAAARLGGFTAAARELGMTQPAVTRHIRSLELALGIDLFRRTSNRSELTDAGRTLQHHVDEGFAGIERGLAALAPRSNVFVLACHPGIAQLWLVPRLEHLQAALGNRELRLWLFHHDDELNGGAYDAAIRVGTGSFSGASATRLFAEAVFPVATSGLAERFGLHRHSTASEVRGAPLLHMDDGERAWLSWNEWFARCGLEPDTAKSTSTPRILFNNYPMVIQQAVAGLGIALGWRYLVDDLINSDVLIQVGPAVQSGAGYYVTWPAGPPADSVRALTEWLVAQTEG